MICRRKEKEMSKRIIAVNAGPRKGWNTDTLITEASKGAESAGAVVERYNLFRLEKYTGCISCFGCKKEKNKGHCICRDGLTPVLDAIREADGLIIGSPNYLGDLTSSFRVMSMFPKRSTAAVRPGRIRVVLSICSTMAGPSIRLPPCSFDRSYRG